MAVTVQHPCGLLVWGSDVWSLRFDPSSVNLSKQISKKIKNTSRNGPLKIKPEKAEAGWNPSAVTCSTALLYVLCFHMSETRTDARRYFISMFVAPAAVRLSVSRSRTICRLPHWLTRGHELLEVSPSTHGVSAAFPSTEDMYDLMCGCRATVWPLCVVFSFQRVMSGRCCLDRTFTTTSIASDTLQSSATGNHLHST